MSLTSMTGFARAAGALGPWRWTVEIKCVNAKGLDLRLRLPPGFDRIEAEARARIGKALSRGACFATISASREGAAAQARLDLTALEEIVSAARAAAAKAGLAPPTMDGVLAVRGIVEVVEAVDDEASFAAVCDGVLESLDAAIVALVAARRAEGGALQTILSERLGAIAALTPPTTIRPVGPRRCAPASPPRWRRCSNRRVGSTRIGCTRRGSCSPPRPTSARSSTD
jgi:uncharacterized protein (TIGR00255 family)